MSFPAKERLAAILATGRFANLPTVWTNVLVGGLLGYPWWTEAHSLDDFFTRLYLTPILLGAFLGSCFYVGGCLLGDAADASWDASHRPERPIPRGILSPGPVSLAGYLLLAIGCGGGSLFNTILGIVNAGFESAVAGWKDAASGNLVHLVYTLSYPQVVLSAFLAVSIVLYARLHKRVGRGAPILMALCRGLLVIWAGTLVHTWFAGNSPATLIGVLLSSVLPYALCISVYTIVLSMVARNESAPDVKLPPTLLQVLLVAPPVGVVLYLFLLGSLVPSASFLGLMVAVGAFLGWSSWSLVRLRRSVPEFVSMALAGFCLVDAGFAVLIGWQAIVICLVGFSMALVLQRVAPAT
jgi:4-hydroxybenzoate polyprenyltransferase